MRREHRSPVLRRLEAAPRWLIVCLGGAAIAITGVADHLSGNDIVLTAVYLLPISLAAWFLSPRAMVLTTCICAGTWLGVDLLDHDLPRHPYVEVINLCLELGTFLLFGLLLATLRRSLDVERALAQTDALTGLWNRRAFWTAAEAELERCRRFGQPFSVAYVDVDGFKGVNDRHGHRKGDELLQMIAVALQDGVRRIDVVARLGGDEFALLLPGTGEEGARIVLDKLRNAFATGPQAAFRVTCSTGCLTALRAPQDVDDLIARTDAVMYAAKKSHAGELLHEVFPHRPSERSQVAADAG